jgi:hypothetical protein
VVVDGGVDVYGISLPFTKLFTMNANTFKEQGYTGNWNPKRVFGNREFKSNLIFIHNEDNLVLANFQGQAAYVSSVAYLAAGADVALGIGENTFFLVQKVA